MTANSRIEHFKVKDGKLISHLCGSLKEALDAVEETTIDWINIVSYRDSGLHKELDEFFKVHALIIEDIENINHLPKFEQHEDYFYFTLKDILFENGKLRFFHKSIIVSTELIITINLTDYNSFATMQSRLEGKLGEISKTGITYLFYMLIDVVVDSYFPALEKMREQLEGIEDILLRDESSNMKEEIYQINKEYQLIRKYLLPLSEQLNHFRKDNFRFLNDLNPVYFNDIRDHVLFISGTIENHADIIKGLIDLNNSNINFGTNKIMATLTIIATIFIPLTFVTGVYGMNFENMPELSWKYGYPAVWGVMLISIAVMLIIMKRKKWF